MNRIDFSAADSRHWRTDCSAHGRSNNLQSGSRNRQAIAAIFAIATIKSYLASGFLPHDPIRICGAHLCAIAVRKRS
jgi:hypothetical protein